jgi:hypothetical protein
MEAITTSRRDLIKMAHLGVEKAGNIGIFLRLLSLCWAILLQTSKARLVGSDPSVCLAVDKPSSGSFVQKYYPLSLRAMLTLPNILTLSRIFTVPVLVALLWWPKWELGYGVAYGVYC